MPEPVIPRARWTTWGQAMEHALYGPDGFYRRGEWSGAHFRTSPQVGTAFGTAIARLACGLGLSRILEVGAGRGELLHAVHASDPTLQLHGIDLTPRPALPPEAGWTTGRYRPGDRLPAGFDHQSLVVAHEWLDVIPVDVVCGTAHGPRLVLVDPLTGRERLGPPPGSSDAAWLRRWWSPLGVGDRAEVGRARDAAWAGLVG
ncbi:MAG: SAM-dependent methyltransferase, partial [Actinomycetes bacterium]